MEFRPEVGIAEEKQIGLTQEKRIHGDFRRNYNERRVYLVSFLKST